MPGRYLRDGILTSAPVNSLSAHAELFYRRLMSVVDDFGRYYAAPTILRAACYPLQIDRVREADISRHLAEAQRAGLIVLYTVDGTAYLSFRKVDPPRAKTSKFPAPPGDNCLQAESTCLQPVSKLPRHSDTETTTAAAARAPRELPRESAREAAPGENGGGGGGNGQKPGGKAPAAADLRSELLDAGVTERKVDELTPALAARGVTAVHVHLLAHELARKKGIDDRAAVLVARLSNGFQPREYLTITEVVQLARRPGLLSLAGKPLAGKTLKFNDGSHDPCVMWAGPDGTPYRVGVNDLRAAAVVLARGGK